MTTSEPGAAAGRRGRPAALDDPLSEALVRTRRFFTKAEVSADLRTLHRSGGRQADDFYRDRWSHDKVVRSTHGVNCTGSCSWKVYVKDGIITWESQQTDYPSVGPDSPEYEPRGCPRGAAFSWYTYSPTRVRYPYVRGVLLEMYREAKARTTATRCSPGPTSSTTPSGPGATSGPAARAAWCAPPGRRPARSSRPPTSHDQEVRPRPGRRVLADPGDVDGVARVRCALRLLIGGSMLSFYDWYADLPVASPQVFGDQTDVPESGDWWDAGYLIMWGSNLPVTRTPDAHWMTEARYRGQKVVAVSPDYADNVKFADEWLAAQPGTDGALAMAMGHVVAQGVLRRPAGALLHRVREEATPTCRSWSGSRSATASYYAGKFLTAADLEGDAGRGERRTSRPCCSTRATGRAGRAARLAGPPVRRRPVPAGGTSTSATSTRCSPLPAAPRRRSRCCCRASTPRTARPRSCARGVPVRRVGGHLVTTVFDLMLAQYGVSRDGLPGEWPTGYDDADEPYTPGLAGDHHRRAGRDGRADRPGVRRQRRGVPRPLDDPDGCRHQPLVPLRHDLPRVPRR